MGLVNNMKTDRVVTNNCERVCRVLHTFFLGMYALGLFYYAYIWEYNLMVLLDIFSSISNIDPGLGSALIGMYLLSSLGIILLSVLYINVIDMIFFPKDDDELELDKRIEDIKNKYPEKIARYKVREERYLFKANREREKMEGVRKNNGK